MTLFLHYLTLPYLLRGISVTLEVTGLGLLGGLVAGLILAVMQLSRWRPLSGLARIYTAIFRGTPLILQMVFAYDALPRVGLRLSAVAAAALALAANEAPFIAEMFRSGVRGVDQGQVAAGQALGMTPMVLARRVIAPQAIRVMVPALGNEAINALKNSSLASVIAVQELTLRSTQLASATFNFFPVFFASGVMYLLLAGLISGLQLAAETMLHLDRPAPRARLARLMPWRRLDVAVPSAGPHPGAGPAAGEPAAGGPPVPVAAPPDSPAGTQAPAAVELRDVHKRYGDHLVLRGVDLTVRTGEVVALLGASGSGKSTLLRCINRLEEWEDGEVRISGRRIGYHDDGKRHAAGRLARERASLGVGMVFQQFNLFSHLTARENVAGPLRWVHGMPSADADSRAGELLRQVGLEHRADALPRHLSGGQQQRVAIARALAPRPRVLLLDEPTSALDPELVHEVLEVIRRLAVEERLTMIIVTHQLRFAMEVAGRVVFMHDGTVVEEGPARQVFSRPSHPATARFLRVLGADGTTRVPA